MASIYAISSGWRAQVRLAGRRSVSKVFKTKKEAKDWAREQEAAPFTDLGGGGKAHTVKSIIQEYRDNLAHIGGSKDTSLRIIEHYLGDYRIAELSQASIKEFVRRRSSEQFPQAKKRGRTGPAGPATIKQDLTYLRTLIRHGGALVDSEDCLAALTRLDRVMITLAHTRQISDSQERSRRPTAEELVKLENYFWDRPRAHHSAPTFDVVLFAITTCLRLGEVVGAGGVTFEDLDITNRTLWVRGRKDPRSPRGFDMQIPLVCGPVSHGGYVIDPVDLIVRQRTYRRGQGRIFPYSEGCIHKAFSDAVTKLNIPDLTFHDLRHDGISRLFEADWDIPQVAAVSGHRSWKNLRRYTHLRPSSLQKARPKALEY